MVDTCIESREASTVCLLQMPSPLSGPCADSLGPLCHFPRLRGDELLSLEDRQAGALPPVGQGPAFSKVAWRWLGEGTQGPSQEGAGFSKPFEIQTLLFSLSW